MWILRCDTWRCNMCEAHMLHLQVSHLKIPIHYMPCSYPESSVWGHSWGWPSTNIGSWKYSLFLCDWRLSFSQFIFWTISSCTYYFWIIFGKNIDIKLVCRHCRYICRIFWLIFWRIFGDKIGIKLVCQHCAYICRIFRLIFWRIFWLLEKYLETRLA